MDTEQKFIWFQSHTAVLKDWLEVRCRSSAWEAGTNWPTIGVGSGQAPLAHAGITPPPHKPRGSRRRPGTAPDLTPPTATAPLLSCQRHHTWENGNCRCNLMLKPSHTKNLKQRLPFTSISTAKKTSWRFAMAQGHPWGVQLGLQPLGMGITCPCLNPEAESNL